MRQYTYNIGFAVDGTPLPDPSQFSGSSKSLDTSAERDLTGMLHRSYVAMKVTTKLEWQNIDWGMIQTILTLVNKPQFQFTFPDPNTGALRTATCYAGDRDWPAVRLPHEGDWIGSLSFSVIEY